MSPLRRAIADSARGPVAVHETEQWSQEFAFAPDFLGFSGHFPGYPVVPAVVQVLTAQMLVEAVTGRPLRLTALDNAKFLIQLHPEDVITVRCRQKKVTAAAILYEGTLSVAAGVAASFQLALAEKDAGC
ncbi:MAG: hypothetical protein A2005_11055 [Desulfuromonadales bacterium GWC2_61_20]|nr:MAG: hypothetical protein A2005_11055 [Desulfuromonadales bacterium GWC2_61_20]HAD04622.1 3-hydroxyacyl-ACP dehydratase [Desulfuromonas sp.]HBT82659.1 3-hydroxyacyl-ACP dehydratase [Desulfuromonas sp.]